MNIPTQSITQGYNLYNSEADFQLYLSAVKKLSHVSIKNYTSDFRFFAGWYHSVHTENFDSPRELLNSLVSDDIDMYASYMRQSNIPEKTIRRRLSSLRSFFSFCISQNWIQSNPAVSTLSLNQPNQQKISATDNSKLTDSQTDVKLLLTLFNNEPKISHKVQKDVQEFFEIMYLSQAQ